MHQRSKIIIGWLAAILGTGMIGLGLLLRDTGQWRVQLLAGLWLLSLLPRAREQALSPAKLGFHRLVLVITLGFSAVGLQLVREQFSQADDIRRRAAALLQPAAGPDEPLAANPAERTALGSGHVWPVTTQTAARGTIYDSAGKPLANSRDGQRIYRNPDLGHIVGFQSRLYGTSGIEQTYDPFLSGVRMLSPNAFLEARLLGKRIETRTADVYLTLDSRLQQVAQAALGERRGAVVLIDPQNGAILALATYPRFDPNTLILPDQASQAEVERVQAAWQALRDNPASPLLNRATQGRYPPGSIIKTFTAAAALDSGVLTVPESQVTCPNRFATETGAPEVRNAVENLAQRTGDPSDLRRVFAWSCNTAFAQIGLNLGPARFGYYANRFGLGYADAPLPPELRDLPAESGTIAGSSIFLERRVALADTAFGQGQALVTPLDMAQMVALIGTDGRMLRPYLVREVRSGEQVLYSAQPEILRQVISPAAAAAMREIMRSSVEFGYAKPVALPGVTIGAKTGTAETPNGAPHSWFVALAPLEQPRFAIAVIVENGGEGSRNALPVARQVLAAALGIKP